MSMVNIQETLDVNDVLSLKLSKHDFQNLKTKLISKRKSIFQKIRLTKKR